MQFSVSVSVGAISSEPTLYAGPSITSFFLFGL